MWLSPDEWSALVLSLKVAACGVGLSIPPGIACAWLLARRRFAGRGLLNVLVHLPLVLPPVAVGYLLLVTLGRSGVVGSRLHSLGPDLAFTWKAAAIAAGVMGFPLLVRGSQVAIEMTDRKFEDAARTLGAGAWRIFATITLPLAGPGIVAGVLLAFARSLGEFGATITFAGNIAGETRTLPVAMYSLAQSPGGDAAALRLIAVSVLLSVLALAASEFLTRRLRSRAGETAP